LNFRLKKDNLIMTKILAIDDQPDNLISLKALITESMPDSQFFMATNGLKGIELAIENDPDLVLLDVVMPGMDGFEVCCRLKQNQQVSDIPVVFLTADRGRKDSYLQALDSGAEAFLSKPISQPELIAQIKAMVKVKKANRQARDEKERLTSLVEERTRELEHSQIQLQKLVEELHDEIEARKLIEKDLRENEEKFRSIFEHHTAVKLIIEPETGRIIDANHSAEKYYGWPRQQLLNMNIQEINTLSPEEIKLAMEKANKKEQVIFEFRHRLANGEIRDVEVYSSKIEVKGKFLLHSIVHDITERKQAEAAIVLSESRLKQAEIVSKSGNWELHLDSKMIIASEGAAKLYGVAVQKLNYQLVREFPLPEFRPTLDDAMKKLIQEGQPYDLEFKIQTADTGEIKDIHSVASFDREKRIVFGVINDITDRKKTEEALKESEAKYRALFTQMSEGFALHELIYDENHVAVDYKIIEINTGYEKQLGIDASQAIGKMATTLYGVSPAPYIDLYSCVAETGEPQFFETYFPPLDKHFVISVFSPYKGYFATVFSDITSRKQSEDYLRESEARLRELNATKDKFFSIIAHDLRSPFNSILGLSTMMVEQARENDFEGMSEYAEIIRTSSQHAMNLLMNLLEWSRSQTGRIEFSPEYIDVFNQINEVSQLLVESANQKSIAILKQIPRNTLVFADKAMLGIILRNLISNAIKFSHPGGEITISAEKKDLELLIEVEDHGVGIKHQGLEKLFRIDQTYSTLGTQNEMGTGLGLILCKEFVEKHGGRIWVESEPGKGSKFSFAIPKA
jgi:PAS domain S-box-containing protein